MIGVIEGLGPRDPDDREPSGGANLLALGPTEERLGRSQELVRPFAKRRRDDAGGCECQGRDLRTTPGLIYVRESDLVAVRSSCRLPATGRTAIDYTRRVLNSLTADDPMALLRGIWRYLTDPSTPIDWLRPTQQPKLGVLHQLDHELLRLLGHRGRSSVSVSGLPSHHVVIVRGVCPAMR